MRRFAAILSAVLFVSTGWAERSAPGDVLDWRKTESGAEFTCEGGRVELSFLRGDLLRVHYVPSAFPEPDEMSMLPEREWVPVGVNARRGEAGVELLAQGMSVVVGEAPFALRVMDSRGEELTSQRGPAFWFDDAAPGMAFSRRGGELLYGATSYGLRGGHRVGLLREGRTPVYLEHGNNVAPLLLSTVGYFVFCDTPWVSNYDIGRDGWSWAAYGGRADFYIGVAPSIGRLLEIYTDLTGRPPMPPLYAFGFMLSRWGVESQGEMIELVDEYRRRGIPLDVLILDYDWFTNDFDWNLSKFPEPEEFVDGLAARGVHFVPIRKPRVYNERAKEAAEAGYLITVEGEATENMDFTSEGARTWWWGKNEYLVDMGVTGWWLDEADWVKEGWSFGNGEWRKNVNTWFWLWAKAIYEGQRAHTGERCWTLNRAGYSGMQRFGAAYWSGDIEASFDHLLKQPSVGLCSNLLGMGYWGVDIGGFFGHPSEELYCRFLQAGTFFPVCRAHGVHNEKRSPWRYGPDAEAVAHRCLGLRYRLMPYIYAAARRMHEAGEPMMQPLALAFQGDERFADVVHEWMFGRDLLVAPVLFEGQTQREVILPAGRWTDLWTDREYRGPASISVPVDVRSVPVFVKAGAVIPTTVPMAYTAEKPWDPVTIEVYPASSGGGITLYEDDGRTYAYENGEYATTIITSGQTGVGGLSVLIDRTRGAYASAVPQRRYVVRAHNQGPPTSVSLNGEPLRERGSASDAERGWTYDPARRVVEVAIGAREHMERSEVIVESGGDLPRAELAYQLRGFSAMAGAAAEEAGESAAATLADIAANAATMLDELVSGAAPTEEVDARFDELCGAFARAVSPSEEAEASLLPFSARAGLMPYAGSPTGLGLTVTLSVPGWALAVRAEVTPSVPEGWAVYPPLWRGLVIPGADSVAAFALNPGGSLIPSMVECGAEASADFLGATAARRVTASLGSGYCLVWNIVGPFPSEAGAGFHFAFPPETDLDLSMTYKGGAIHAGDREAGLREFDVAWKRARVSIDDGIVNLIDELDLYEEAVAYGLTYVHSPREREATLLLGSDDGVKVWLNGDLVHSVNTERGVTPDEDDVVVRLREGANTLLLKVVQGGGGWGFCARFTDEGGKPLGDLRYSAEPVD